MITQPQTGLLIAVPEQQIEVMKQFWNHRNRLLAYDDQLTHHDRVLQLGIGIGLVAAFVNYNQVTNGNATLKDKLTDVGAFAYGWLERLEGNAGIDCAYLILDERKRQDKLFRSGELPFNCNSPVVDDRRKFGVLLEEGGEVAEAVDFLDSTETKGCREHLKTELVQVCAVCMAWITTPARKGAKS